MFFCRPSKSLQLLRRSSSWVKKVVPRVWFELLLRWVSISISATLGSVFLFIFAKDDYISSKLQLWLPKHICISCMNLNSWILTSSLFSREISSFNRGCGSCAINLTPWRSNSRKWFLREIPIVFSEDFDEACSWPIWCPRTSVLFYISSGISVRPLKFLFLLTTTKPRSLPLSASIDCRELYKLSISTQNGGYLNLAVSSMRTF